jgi:hypothetical protein
MRSMTDPIQAPYPGARILGGTIPGDAGECGGFVREVVDAVSDRKGGTTVTWLVNGYLFSAPLAFWQRHNRGAKVLEAKP